LIIQLFTNSIASDSTQFNATPAIAGKKIFLRSDKAIYCFENDTPLSGPDIRSQNNIRLRHLVSWISTETEPSAAMNRDYVSERQSGVNLRFQTHHHATGDGPNGRMVVPKSGIMPPGTNNKEIN